MPNTDYFRSITQEITALKNRVRHLISDAHWPTDGEWKESVLRTMLRRHIPRQFGVGRGFILANEGRSSQVDVLIYDTSKPILHQDGDLVLSTTDAVLGIVEVKTSLSPATFDETVEKAVRNVEFVNRRLGYGQCLHCLFVYEWDYDLNCVPRLLDVLNATARGCEQRRLNCICLGSSLFIRFWDQPPGSTNHERNIWRAYRLDEMAPAYFLHNIFEHLSPQSVLANNSLWFPDSGKEVHRIGELAFH